jgi:aldose 1-epimerase
MSTLSAFGQYTIQRGDDLIRLEDTKAQIVVNYMPSKNTAFQMLVKGNNIIRYPYQTAEEYKARGGNLLGVPLLWPWANRLDEGAFWANGKKYTFNLDIGVIGRGGRGGRGGAAANPATPPPPPPPLIPIHGFVQNATQWELVEAKADANSAWVTSRLDFYKYPDWMAQFPFAHTLEMTYRLKDGSLEVFTKINNLSTQPMPVTIGFHPYFVLSDSTREEWTFGIGAKTHWLLAPNKIPTGETEPIEKFIPGQPEGAALKGLNIDDVFTDLIRDARGRATMWMQGKQQRIEVSMGPNYKTAVVYSPGPPNNEFIAYEPMAGITNAMNAAQKGLYKELQSVAPGQAWQETFWITPKGF